nr:translation initiation factor IF-2-like [Aegilops tauschii subsp. strangulata]
MAACSLRPAPAVAGSRLRQLLPSATPAMASFYSARAPPTGQPEPSAAGSPGAPMTACVARLTRSRAARRRLRRLRRVRLRPAAVTPPPSSQDHQPALRLRGRLRLLRRAASSLPLGRARACSTSSPAASGSPMPPRAQPGQASVARGVSRSPDRRLRLRWRLGRARRLRLPTRRLDRLRLLRRAASSLPLGRARACSTSSPAASGSPMPPRAQPGPASVARGASRSPDRRLRLRSRLGHARRLRLPAPPNTDDRLRRLPSLPQPGRRLRSDPAAGCRRPAPAD